MRKEFCPGMSVAEAWAKCPWAAAMVRADGGIWCFESGVDFCAWYNRE